MSSFSAGEYQAHFKSVFEIGSVRIRFPVAANIAPHNAGNAGGSIGSPNPVGGLEIHTLRDPRNLVPSFPHKEVNMFQRTPRTNALVRWRLPLVVGVISALSFSAKADAAPRRSAECFSWTGCVGAPLCKPVDQQVWCMGQENQPGCFGGEGDCP